MTVRTTLYEVIQKLRDRIGDTASTPVFTDNELQAVLDGQRVDVRYLELLPVPTIAAGGVVTYLDYWTPPAYRGVMWDAGEVLQDGSYNVLSATADRENGRWQFAAHQDAPVWLTGTAYNMPAAAADALERWAAKLKFDFDFSADGASYQRSQKIRALLELARQMRAMAPAGVAQMLV